MALAKQVDQGTGVFAAYWRVTETHVNWEDKTLLVRVGGYLNEDARREGKKPLTLWQGIFREDGFPLTVEGKNVAETYAALKTNAFFKDAEDA